MPTHDLSDRYWVKPDGEGWNIRYGPSAPGELGECVGHVHDAAHAELICAAVNEILEFREWKRRTH